MKTCPDCPGQTLAKKYGEPTLSSGSFLDQIIVCSVGCGWCGVESVTLTEAQADEFRLKPRQLRLL